MNVSLDSQFEFESEAGAEFRRSDVSSDALRAMAGMGVGARAGVVNRTHRVVRERAKVMQKRRSRARSLMAPLILCSVLLILTAVAVWTGLYQYQAVEAAEAVQADVSALAAVDANNHFLVVLLWFVPVSLALLATIWFRRARGGADSEARR
jgi:hypothetical protein